MLTRAQIDHYDEHGYLVIEGLLDAATVDGLKRVTDDFVERACLATACDRRLYRHDGARSSSVEVA